MRSTEKPKCLWWRLCCVVLGLYLAVPACATSPSDPVAVAPDLDDSSGGNHIPWAPCFELAVDGAQIAMGVSDVVLSSRNPGGCSSSDNGYRVHRGNMHNDALPETQSDGTVDSSDTISSGVTFIGGDPAVGASGDGVTRETLNDPSGNITTQVKTSAGGSRRIMWRQIQ